ncbi:MAG TPA: lysophospholipid acyltransferase family protein [Thermoclostridium sp.]|nr:lysophospholipid acyltransferase family protein [Thermoclostridium sp.]HPU45569.1 lysophospholipid acyltransferase family protein [Thermoclostridium sp.]
MTYRVKRASRLLNRILKKTLGPWLVNRYRIEFIEGNMRDLKPPFVVIGNHTNNWDPFILSCKISEPIHFVTSVEQFRSRTMRFLLGLAGCIPKTKAMSDATTVKSIFHVRNRGDVVGVFPEGKRCWDGKTEEILYPTAKVLKSLGVPVVAFQVNGAYLSHPRWAVTSRKGKIQINYGILFTPEQLKTLSADEIYEKMCAALRTNEYSWQEERMIPFVGKRLAERLERVLFLCPKCGQVGRLYSKGDTLTCLACGETVTYNQYGYFEKDGGEPHFKSVLEWNQWQLKELEGMVLDRMANPDGPIFEDREVTLFTGQRYVAIRKLRRGTLRLYADRLEFIGRDNQKIEFGLSLMNGVSTHLSDWFDFYHEGNFYRAAFKNRHTSANKYTEAYDIIKRLQHGEHHAREE